MGIDNTGTPPEEVKKAIECYIECENLDTGGVLKCFLPIFTVKFNLRNQGLPEDQFKEKIIAAYISCLQDWEKYDPDHLITNEDCFWLIFIAEELGIGDFMGRGLLQWTIEHNPETVYKNINKKRENGTIPASLSNAEYLGLIFDPPELKITPGHPYYKSLGVNNAAEWHALKENRLPTLAKHIDAHARELIRAMAKAYERQDWEPDRVERNGEYYYIKRFTELSDREISNLGNESLEENLYLDDYDRLSQFFDLAGIEMSSFTDSECHMIAELINVFDAGYSRASKQGISLKDYYGDKADSKKTQWYRLRNKIKAANSKFK